MWTKCSHLISIYTAAAAKSLQSCPTLCDPIDSIPPDSPIPGILQARTLEWVAISFSIVSKVTLFSPVRLLVTPWTAAYQASASMGFSRQEYWSGLPLPSPWYTVVMSVRFFSFSLTRFCILHLQNSSLLLFSYFILFKLFWIHIL